MDFLDGSSPFPSNQLRLVSGILSDAGRLRTDNEDYALAFLPEDWTVQQKSGCLFIVADGSGGRTCGEGASRYATEQVLNRYYKQDDLRVEERLEIVLREVGNDLYYRSEGEDLACGMTTLVVAVVIDNRLTVANVGDSRAYLIHDGQAQQITRDHNQMSELLHMDELSVAEIESASNQNRLTRSIGGQVDVEIDLFPDIPLLPGDVLLLCTDGLTRYISDEQITLITETGSSEYICRRLVDWANRAGGDDNVTVLVVQFLGDELYSPEDGSRVEVQSVSLPIPGAHITDRRSTELHPDRKRLFWLGSLFAGVVLLLLFAWLLISRLDLTTPLTVAPPPSTSDNSLAVPVSTPQPTLIETPGAELLISATPEVSPSPANWPSSSVCIWPVESGQTLYSIIRGFELVYRAEDEYFYYDTCDLEKGICSGEPAMIESHASIYSGWNIIIPVASEEDCLNGQGNWISSGN